MIKAVIFDLDHTLFDRYATLRLAAEKMRDKFPVNDGLSDEEIAEIMINADKKFIHSGWDAVERHIVQSTPLFKEKLADKAYFSFVTDFFSSAAVPHPFVIPMLLTLRERGIKTGLITNGILGLQERKLAMLGLTEKFDEIIICGRYGCPKPSPVPFEIMAKRLGLRPDEMMYVGDHPKNDVDASRKVGYVPVFVNTVGFWALPEIQKCELTVETVKEIPTLLELYNNQTEKL